MHEMQSILIDVGGVCLSICHAAHLGLAVQKMAEQIKKLFRMNTSGGPWNVVLDVIPTQRRRVKAAAKWAPKGKMVKSI